MICHMAVWEKVQITLKDLDNSFLNLKRANDDDENGYHDNDYEKSFDNNAV